MTNDTSAAPGGEAQAALSSEPTDEFRRRLVEYGVAMAHRQGEKARVLSEVLESMHEEAKSLADSEGTRAVTYLRRARKAEASLAAPQLSMQATAEQGEATEAMTDAVRPLIVAIEIAGRTYGSVRAHCKRAGMDLDTWPAWALETHAGEHFTKAACAALVWHCMNEARPTQKKEGGNV